ncbi:MAG: pyridoxal 5'-phosphate synthase glutaminase subunit PdxT [Patescibacteria group bacterium]
MKKIGIIAIHGDVAEHGAVLRKLKFAVVEVRAAKDFAKLDGLILPGGESTTISKLAEKFGLVSEIKKFAASGKPILGTCAGLILLARFGLLNIEVARNAYGRQIDSFETELAIPKIAKDKIPVAFIRAPKIISVGKSVEVLAEFENVPVLVRQENIFGTSCHPEILGTTTIHEFIFAK